MELYSQDFVIIFKISEKPKIQTEIFDERDPETYYSAVISHSHYSIFYATKAYLLSKDIEITAPEEHKKAFEEFKRIVESGELDIELLKIYQDAIIRAESLLGIFKLKKKKRGGFTYRTLPQANKEPALESINNSKKFYAHILRLYKNN